MQFWLAEDPERLVCAIFKTFCHVLRSTVSIGERVLPISGCTTPMAPWHSWAEDKDPT